MTWNVFIYNINSHEIEIYNIFNHYNFNEWVKRDLEEFNSKLEFSKALRSNLMYYFWAKSEWEIILTPWVGGNKEKDAVKIDVYTQVINNFEIFLDYIWNNKKAGNNHD